MRAVLLMALCISFCSIAEVQKPHCFYDGKKLAIGESVWVVDPVLVEKARNSMLKQEYDEDAIARELRRSDWVGYRLMCVNTFDPNAQTGLKQAGDVIAPNGAALVLNEYSRDFYQHVVNNQ